MSLLCKKAYQPTSSRPFTGYEHCNIQPGDSVPTHTAMSKVEVCESLICLLGVDKRSSLSLNIGVFIALNNSNYVSFLKVVIKEERTLLLGPDFG